MSKYKNTYFSRKSIVVTINLSNINFIILKYCVFNCQIMSDRITKRTLYTYKETYNLTVR